MSSWHSLYLPSTESDPSSGVHGDFVAAVTAALKTSLTDHGYTLYDPFGLMPAVHAYSESIKAFVAPALQGEGQPGWTRLILAPDSPLSGFLVADLSKLAPCLAVSLTEGAAVIRVYHTGAEIPGLEAGLALLKPGTRTAPPLPEINTSAAPPSSATAGDFPLDALSDDLKRMTGGLSARHQVNPRQAQQMFNKITGNLLKGKDQAGARDLLTGDAVDWNSPGGQTIAALMQSLGIAAWREPDYVPLRDAWQLHNRRRRNPKAALYPGDAEAMAAVPDALRYTPVFAGK